MKQNRISRIICVLLVALLTFMLVSCGNNSQAPESSGQTQESQEASPSASDTPAWQFEVGSDVVEEEAVGASEYDPTYTVNLKIVGAEDDVLFNGKVTIKSPTMYGNEFLKAAVTDKGLAQSGIETGFVETIGDYVNNSTDNIYWLYTVNGASPAFGSNLYQMRDGDYMLWEYKAADGMEGSEATAPITGDWAFEVGSDVVEEEAVGASEYDPTYTVNLKIVGAEDDVLFNGKVTIKSPTMYGNEFLKAAVTDKGLAQSGIETGFVETIGDYVNNSTDNIYWLYTVNGASPAFGSNLYQMRDGDYMLWEYKAAE